MANMIHRMDQKMQQQPQPTGYMPATGAAPMPQASSAHAQGAHGGGVTPNWIDFKIDFRGTDKYTQFNGAGSTSHLVWRGRLAEHVCVGNRSFGKLLGWAENGHTYNEIILDVAVHDQGLPYSVEAILYDSLVHKDFIHHFRSRGYDITDADVPLVSFDPLDENEPFKAIR